MTVSLDNVIVDPVPEHGYEPTRQLADLLDLDTIGRTITRARIVGHGSRASADIWLDDGTVIAFESMRDVGNPTRLALEVASTTGATPKLKVPQALLAISLLRVIAELEVAFTTDDIAREWGTLYLDQAAIQDVVLDDQAARWQAFSDMHNLDPSGSHRAGSAPSVASASIVLRAPDGTRYVRAGWFAEHVRERENVSPADIAHRMERVGWTRRGRTGRIKATSPRTSQQIGWNFHVVPAGWEHQ